MKKHIKLANEIREFINKLNSSVGEVACEIENIVNKHSPVEKPFPKIMQHGVNGVVVLFKCRNSGTIIIKNDSPQSVGWHSDLWSGKNFKDCEIQVKP